jgi:hypothetical protein
MQYVISFLCSFIFALIHIHVRRVLCHYGDALSQVVDGKDGIQLWRVALNILNKQLWTPEKRWSSSFSVGHGGKPPHCKHKPVMKYLTEHQNCSFFG